MKTIKLEIIPRDVLEHTARVMGQSSAAASAVRMLETMGANAENYVVCRDRSNTLVLMERKYLQPTETLQ